MANNEILCHILEKKKDLCPLMIKRKGKKSGPTALPSFPSIFKTSRLTNCMNTSKGLKEFEVTLKGSQSCIR